MDQAKNFKIKDIILRTPAFVIYFTVSGFIGVMMGGFIFNSFVQIILRNNPALKDIILYLISLLAIFAALCFFSMREGFTDTQNLRFSILKTSICYCAAGIIFFVSIVCLDIYVFGETGNFFKEQIFQPYYADENISNFLGNTVSAGSTGYVASGILILLNIGAMIPAYKAGRLYWIARQKKRVMERRRTGR